MGLFNYTIMPRISARAWSRVGAYSREALNRGGAYLKKNLEVTKKMNVFLFLGVRKVLTSVHQYLLACWIYLQIMDRIYANYMSNDSYIVDFHGSPNPANRSSIFER